jgi:serine phosphatase RsbU (regulator of sigma subunit)
MSPRRRLISAVVITAIAFVALTLLLVLRAQYWNSAGWTGVNFISATQANAKVRVNTASGPSASIRRGMTQPGTVLVIVPSGPAYRAGLDSRDVVTSINGIPLADLDRIQELDRRLHTGDIVTYALNRDGALRDVRLTLVAPLQIPWMLISMVLSLALAVSYAVIGLVVFIRRPDDRRAAVFYAMSTAGALSFLIGTIISLDGSSLRGIVTTPERPLVVVVVYLLATFIFGALTLHLALVFPRDRPVIRTRPSVTRWIYVIPVSAALLLGATVALVLFGSSASGSQRLDTLLSKGLRFVIPPLALLGAILALRIARLGRREGTKNAFLSRPVQSVVAIYAGIATIALLIALARPGLAIGLLFASGALPALGLIAYPVMTFIALYRSYRDSSLEEKRQVKWPLWGTMIAVGSKIAFGITGVLITMVASMHIVDASTWVGIAQSMEMVPRVLYLLIPISFAVAILKYRLMNIDVIIKKTVAYGILTGAIIIIYLVLVGGLGTLLVNVAGVRNQTMVIASTLVVALLFVPLRNKLQFLVDRNLFRQKYDYPQALKAIAGETLAATDLRAFFVFAAETLQQALQNRSVLMFERREDHLVAIAKVGLPDSVLGSARIDGVSADAVDRPLDPRRRALPEGAAAVLRRVESALVLPVRSKGVMHGLVSLGAKLSDREFDLEDLEFLSSAVDQIAITIDRVRLQTEEQDFEQARRMQQSLLPAAAPQIDGVDVSGTWKPARAVGGDYYDLLRLGDTQLAVCIGDVAGKGMPAALLMSAVQAAVRASATPEIAPADLCERVRRVIVQSLSGGRFVTFFYGTIDTVAHKIRYCNAGHNPPVLVRADGSAIRLDKGGPVLSRLFANAALQGGEEELREGDRLVLFTDGVSEARDSAGNDYGEDRLERVIAENRQSKARELIATIVESVSAYSEGRTDDDLTLVAVAVG